MPVARREAARPGDREPVAARSSHGVLLGDVESSAFWDREPAQRARPARRRDRTGSKNRRGGGKRPKARRQHAGPRALPQQRARGARGPADRMRTGTLVFSIVVGLSLLAIVERSLIEGTTFGDPGPAGSDLQLRSPGQVAQVPPDAERRPAPDRSGPVAAVPDTRALTERITRLTTDQHGLAARQAYGAAPDRPPIVGVDRVSADRRWAFGTTTIPVPAGSSASPEGAFFAGRWGEGQWQVALSGTSSFNAILGRMPADVMPAAEAAALRRYSSLTAEQAVAAANGTRAGDGLMLPWRLGRTWSIGSADGEGKARPLAALAFWGGDGRVLSAAAGRVYRFCAGRTGSGMVMVVHPSGLASTYYRMRDVTSVRSGGTVARGVALGRIGAERPCGGAPAPRSLVQFSLRRGAEEVPLEGTRIGGWTFRQRARPLLGFAERGPMQVLPGGLLANLGAVPDADGPGLPKPGNGGGEAGKEGKEGTPAPSATQNRSSTSADAK
ncbi:hypothetical protein [Spirillospora sp. NPDC029432]|uniref:peptidoglycan DD-metalloendopeptidase family protein n=1 Tax=Spirillospora sp. NPDC029432 TaxID=3154599 RepID=UPI003454278B